MSPHWQLEIFAEGVNHPESVWVADDGYLYTGTALGGYSNTGPVVRIDQETRQVSTFGDTGGRVLGLAGGSHGRIFTCDVQQSSVVVLDASGAVIDRISTIDGWELLRPNGCASDGRGGVWITDSGTAQADEPTGAVLHVSADGVGTLAADGLAYPNGVVASETHVFVTLTRGNALLAFDLSATGQLSGRRVLAGGPDAMELMDGPDGVSLSPRGSVLVAVTRTSRVIEVELDGQHRVLVDDPQLLNIPSHVAVGAAGELYIPSLFGTTICRARRVNPA